MRDNQPLVSIIMPVYNCERFLESALESVVLQEYQSWELLVIDDNSTDGSSAIIKKYAGKEDRIIFLQNNTDVHGPGPARNIGLDHARGDCIYFMDSDDRAEKSLLQCAVSRMQETGADIVQFGAIYERTDGHHLEYYWSGKNLLTKNEIKNNFSHFWNENRNSLWLYLFRRDAVESIRFENMISGEDICYVMDALSNAEKIAYITKALYHYRYVDGSTSHRWIENVVECRERIWSHQRDFLQSFQGDVHKMAYAEVAYDNYIWAIYQLSSRYCPLSYREKRRKLSHLKDTMEFDTYRGIYPLNKQQGIQKVKYMFVKYRLEGIVLRFGPLFLRIVRGE